MSIKLPYDDEPKDALLDDLGATQDRWEKRIRVFMERARRDGFEGVIILNSFDPLSGFNGTVHRCTNRYMGIGLMQQYIADLTSEGS